MSIAINQLYDFGPFRLNPAERLLLHDDEPVHIPPKAFDVLLVLVQRRGQLVTKQELIEAVWPGLFVEEGNVSVMIHALRKALASDENSKYIETISKRGYRFIADVRVVIETKRNFPDDSENSVVAPRITADLPGPAQTPPLGTDTPRPGRLSGLKRHWLWLTVAAVALTVLLLWVGRNSSRKTQTAATVRSLAVLPFAVIGNTANDAFLGLGMSDAITTQLGDTGKLVIRPTSAVEKYIGTSRDPVVVGRELQVDGVLDGRIQFVNDRIRVTVQLIRIADGARIWGSTFYEKYTDIFAVEDAVSEEVTRSIRPELTGTEQRHPAPRPTQNNEAYQAYVKGRYFWNKRTAGGLQKGLVYFQQAAALDPNYAQAYAGIADSYALLGHLTVLPPATSFPQAKDAVAKALKIDPDLAEAHATLGFINMFYNLDGKAAEDEFRLALKNDPNYAIAHIWYAVDLAAMGRDNEATAQATQALVADPLSLTINTDIGLVAYLAGRNDDAIKAIKKALEIDPNFARGHFRLGNAYLKQGLNQQALAEYQKAVRIAGAGDAYFDQNYEGAIGQAYALLGDKKEAQNVLQLLSNRSKTHYVPAYSIALIYAGLGEKDLAFQWLQRAYEDHSTSMAYLKVDPAFSGIRSDPRFASILHLVHF